MTTRSRPPWLAHHLPNAARIATVLVGLAACQARLAPRNSVDGGENTGEQAFADAASAVPDARTAPSCEQVQAAPNIAFDAIPTPAQFFDGLPPASALVAGDDGLYYYDVHANDLRRSTDLDGVWQDLGAASVGRDFTRDATQYSSSVAYSADHGSQGSLFVVRELDSNLHSNIARYDISTATWSIDAQGTLITHGLNAVGGQVYGLHHAGSAGLRRYELQGGADDVGSPLVGTIGDTPNWVSRAAQLVHAEGSFYGTKNDWTTPQSGDSASAGDRLFRFSPAAFNEEGTVVEDLGALPFEVGAGSVVVWLPAAWNNQTSSQGALFITAGFSASDHNGWPTQDAEASDEYVIYDIACRSFRTGSLPEASATGTSAAVYADRLVIKKGAQKLAGEAVTCCDDISWVSKQD